MITYAKYDESDRRTYSIELMKCEEKAVPEMINMFDVGEEISIRELKEMGWHGELARPAEIKSLLNPCYDALWLRPSSMRHSRSMAASRGSLAITGTGQASD